MKFLGLLTLIIHESSIIRVRRQRKLRIKLGQNHFNLNFILTYNICFYRSRNIQGVQSQYFELFWPRTELPVN